MSAERVIIAGFGGQGIMTMGQLLAQAGLDEGRHVTWLPSYGPEMRGGTANCDVILDDAEIASPIVHGDATTVIVMNVPSLKFVADLVPGGVALINTSLGVASIDKELRKLWDADEVRTNASLKGDALLNGKAHTFNLPFCLFHEYITISLNDFQSPFFTRDISLLVEHTSGHTKAARCPCIDGFLH